MVHPLPATAGNIAAAKAVAFEMWLERAAELGNPVPTDLSDSCKFSSLLAQGIFGGEIRGNRDHFHVRLADGTIIDINEDAADVVAMRRRGSNPLLHERTTMRRREIRESLDSCRPRVERWTRRFHERHPEKRA